MPSKWNSKTASAVHTALFAHDPLDRSTFPIRVLQVEPGPESAPVHCGLKQTTIEGGNKYTCLSYVWGIDQPDHTIFINTQPFKVRQNLLDLLIMIRRLNIRDKLWIDAVCIDQMNTAERNHQVQQMAEIYRRAERVLVYLGDMSRWLKWCVILNSMLIRLVEAVANRTKAWQPWGSDVQNRKAFLIMLTWLLSSAHRKRIRPIARRLGSRPYFTRMWIVQELYLARHKQVLTHSGLLSWAHLDRFLVAPGTDWGPTECPQVAWVCSPRNYTPDRPAMHLNRQEITESIHNFKNLQCADARDHVYALFGLLDPQSSTLPVDYDIDTRDLFLEVLVSVYHGDRSQRITPRTWGVEMFIKDLSEALNVSISVLCSNCGDSQQQQQRSSDDNSPSKQEAGDSTLDDDTTTQSVLRFFLYCDRRDDRVSGPCVSCRARILGIDAELERNARRVASVKAVGVAADASAECADGDVNRRLRCVEFICGLREVEDAD